MSYSWKKKKKNLCHWLKVGKNGRREQCCSYFTICKKNKENKSICHNTKRTCKWSSKLVKTFKKSNCFWQPNGGGEQRKCCHWTVKCFGEKCFDLRKKCKWTGKIVTKALDHGCSWVTVGKNTRRQRCCEQSRRCVGKKCTIKNRKCQWRTLPIKLDWITKCKWVKKGNSNNQVCCRYFQHCIRNTCSEKKKKFLSRCRKNYN